MNPIFAGLAFLSAASAPGDAPAQQPEPEVTTRFYRIHELISPTHQFPFTGSLPASSGSNVYPSGGFGGGFGGGGFGGGAGAAGGGGGLGGGGGGFFSVPPAQFGGQGGGGLGGGGVDFGFGQAAEPNQFIYAHDADSVADLVVTNVDEDSWEDNGGRGTIKSLGNVLMVRQTEKNHAAIAAFLNELTDAVTGGKPLVIEAWWLPLNPGERRRLAEILSGDAKAAGADLTDLAETSGGYHGELRCRDGRTAHMTSGHRRPLVVGNVPVVGTDTSANQPIVSHVNIGLMLQVTPRLRSSWRERNEDELHDAALEVRTAITTSTGEQRRAAGVGEIDRFDIGAHVLEGASMCDLNRPLVIGSLSAVGIEPAAGEDQNEIYLVIELRR